MYNIVYAIKVTYGRGYALSKTLFYRFVNSADAEKLRDSLNDLLSPMYMHEVIEVKETEHDSFKA